MHGPAELPAGVDAPAMGNPIGKYIKHVVVIVQENRSFDNLFAGYPGADAPTHGYGLRGRIALRPITFVGPDFVHDWETAVADWDHGKMDGFSQFVLPSGGTPYSYVRRDLIRPYWSMARQYVLADHMFPTEFGGSFTAHFDLIAGTFNLSPTLAEADTPPSGYACDAPPGTKSYTVNARREVSPLTGPFPCFTQFDTMAATLDAARVPWRYYATTVLDGGIWSPFEGVSSVRYGRDWKTKIIAPSKRILGDLGNGKLASVTWVTPSLKDSDHPLGKSNLGPSWVAGIVNAIGESRYWKSTAIIVVWDDWGGWYDNVPPPQLDFVGLGIRVPCIIISPYAKKGYVSHTRYEYGSILKFIEQTFNLPALASLHYGSGYTDARANSLEDGFNFTQRPRPFKKISAPFPPEYFLAEPPSNQPPDYE